MGVGCFSTNTLAFVFVVPNGFAERLGFKTGDAVQAFDRVPLSDLDDLKKRIKDSLGKSVKIEVLRGGKVLEITIKVPSEIPKEFVSS